MKKYIAVLAMSLIVFSQVSCTSSDSGSDEEVAESDATSTEAVDSELEAIDDGEIAATDETNENFVDTQPAEEALGEAPEQSEIAAEPTPEPAPEPTLEASTDAVTTTEEDLLVEETAAMTPETQVPVESPIVADTSSEVDIASTNTIVEPTPAAIVIEEPPAPKPVMASYRKIERVPFKTAGVLLNSVYIARKGDTFTGISKMVYQSPSKANDLRKWNPTISKVTVGDKIYYNSPNRPTDESVVLTYFEDTGVNAENYIAQDGETVRGVASKVLGSSLGWKELYATNDFEEKNYDKLPAGTVVKYWKKPEPSVQPPVTMPELASNSGMSGSAAVPETLPTEMPSVAMQEPMAPPMDMPPPPPVDMPPPPPADFAQAPPPPVDMPPPPPMESIPPAAPVASVSEVPMDTASSGVLGLGEDVELALGAGLILAAGVAGLLIARRRRANREMTSAFSDTQVGV